MSIALLYLATAAITSAILAVTRRNPVHSVLWVLAVFLHVGGIFLLADAEFLAAVQVIVYAGAILVFYLFFLMLLDLPAAAADRPFNAYWPVCVVLGALFAAVVSFAQAPGLAPRPGSEAVGASPAYGRPGATPQEELRAAPGLPRRPAVDWAPAAPPDAPGDPTAGGVRVPGGRVTALGQVLFTQFALPFEVASLILLAAIVGAVALARRKTES